MRTVDMTNIQSRALRKYCEAGAGRISHVFMRSDETSKVLTATAQHKLAAELTMQTIEATCVRPLTCDEAKLKGSKIALTT